ncbi:hypothetical protein ACIQWN_34545 [Streptomyces vinaceus]|uniref:hypothetical protein n=1 Tax=Streptomyces vinaceus TaxID=1960 RepID=UPI003821266F
MKSAAALLSVVEEKAEPHPKHPGAFIIPDPSPLAQTILSGPWAQGRLTGLDTRIQVTVLRDGIRATQPSRHASGTGGLEPLHIFCLVELDSHASLQRLTKERKQPALRGVLEADRQARSLASTVLQRIGPQ